MNYYKIKHESGKIEILKAINTLALIKKYHLATKEHINTVISQLGGEQLAIAISNEL